MSRIRSLDELYQDAMRGNAAAQFEFAKMLEAKGPDDRLEQARAKVWYERAVKQGYEEAKLPLMVLERQFEFRKGIMPAWDSLLFNMISPLKALNYPITVKGACHGVAIKGVEAALLGQIDIYNNRAIRIIKLYEHNTQGKIEVISQELKTEEKTEPILLDTSPALDEKCKLLNQKVVEAKRNMVFNLSVGSENIELLYNFSENQWIIKEEKDVPGKVVSAEHFAKAIKKILDQNFKKKFEKENDWWEMLAYLDGVALHLAPEEFKDILGKTYQQTDFAALNLFTTSQAIETPEHKGFRRIEPSIVGAYTSNELDSYCELLNRQAKRHGRNVALNLGASGHSVTFFYNAKNDYWIMIDANEMPVKIIPPHHLNEAIKKSLYKNLSGDEWVHHVFPLSTRIITTGAELKGAEEFSMDLQNAEAFKEIHTVTPERLAYKGIKNINLWELAVRENNLEVARQILAIPEFDINQLDESGVSLAYWAFLKNDSKDLFRLIAASGRADLNLRNRGFSYLEKAILNSDIEGIKILITYGANINIKNNNGQTPVMFAIQHNKINELKMLIDAHADINEKDMEGFSPIEYAVMNNKADILKILLEGSVVVNDPLLMLSAMQNQNLAILKMLVSAGAPINLSSMINDNDVAALHLLIQAGMSTSHFYQRAIDENNRPLFTFLANAGIAVLPKEVCYAFYRGNRDAGSWLEQAFLRDIPSVLNLLTEYSNMSVYRIQHLTPAEQKEKSAAMTQLNVLSNTLVEKLSSYSGDKLRAFQEIYFHIKNAYDQIYSLPGKGDIPVLLCQEEIKLIQHHLGSSNHPGNNLFSSDNLGSLLEDAIKESVATLIPKKQP